MFDECLLTTLFLSGSKGFDTIWSMKDLVPLFALFASYVMYSRAVTIPAGVALHMRPEMIFFAVFILDMAQVPMLKHFYEKGSRLPFIRKLDLRSTATRRLSQSRTGKRAQRLGPWGVVLLASLPCLGGGMWTAVLLCHILGLDRRQSYAYLAAGSLIGCFVLTFASKMGVDLILHLKTVILGWLSQFWPLGETGT